MSRNRRWLTSAVIVFFVVLGGGILWITDVAEPLPAAMQALDSDAAVRVTRGDWLVFEPTESAPDTGLIFYPGGKVPPEAYAPFARDIAGAGYRVVIVPMPLNLAVLGIERARDVMAAYPDIQHWAIAGHSLGGSMAARFAHDHPDLIDGLALWAAYPEDSKDLSGSDLVAASIYGTLDGLAAVDEIERSRALLPPDTLYVPIEGGNHAQFGWYGDQAGDNPATISPEDQQAQTVAATLYVLERIQNS
jgi:hypothetical protein